MKKSLIQIINEVIQDFYNDWDNNEPSIADKSFERMVGSSSAVKKPEQKIDGELVDYIDYQFGKYTKLPYPIYKNPKNLNGFEAHCRGILMNTGDFYVAQNFDVAHESILEMLAEKGQVPHDSKKTYYYQYPRTFVAVVRIANSITFGQSSAYDEFPPEYMEIFKIGEAKQPFHFRAYKTS